MDGIIVGALSEKRYWTLVHWTLVQWTKVKSHLNFDCGHETITEIVLYNQYYIKRLIVQRMLYQRWSQ
jgi:hypothetical protein